MIAKQNGGTIYLFHKKQKETAHQKNRYKYHVMGISILNIFYIWENDNDPDPVMQIKNNDTFFCNIICLLFENFAIF